MRDQILNFRLQLLVLLVVFCTLHGLAIVCLSFLRTFTFLFLSFVFKLRRKDVYQFPKENAIILYNLYGKD